MKKFIPKTQIIVNGLHKALAKLLTDQPLTDEDRAFLSCMEVDDD